MSSCYAIEMQPLDKGPCLRGGGGGEGGGGGDRKVRKMLVILIKFASHHEIIHYVFVPRSANFL